MSHNIINYFLFFDRYYYYYLKTRKTHKKINKKLI